jgi:predicted MPP superfamily phosphohydrolase
VSEGFLSRRAFLTGAAGITTGLVACGAYARWVEPEWLRIAQRIMPIRDLPSSLTGKLLVQLSDIHVGPKVSDDYVLRTFDRVRALQPDIVVYTGDFTSHHEGLFAHAERVYSTMVHGRLATFASLGNHDYGLGWAQPEEAARIAAILRNLGVTVLVNAVSAVDGLQFVGLGDVWGGQFNPAQAFAQLVPNQPAIAMSHNPDTLDMAGWEPFRGWVLSGHTHGGQCKPPFLPPPVLPVKNKRYTRGEFDVGRGRTLYINCGVGTVLPVRFNVRPEVTAFTLTQA